MPEDFLTEAAGIFGGSFNPVHIGHYQLAVELSRHRHMPELHIFPTACNPLKKDFDMLPDALRLSMLQATMSQLPRTYVNPFELERGGISYSIDTVTYMKQRTQRPLALIIGYDAYRHFGLWREADYILSVCRLVVFYRKREPIVEPDFFCGRSKPTFICADLPDVSSTFIRANPLDAARHIHPAALPIWQAYHESRA